MVTIHFFIHFFIHGNHSFLHKHKIFYKYQFGFRKNHETTNALTEVIDYIYKSLDEGNYVFGIYIDLKKAFDTVQHDILLSKLQHYGIRGIAFEWFRSYLAKRKQYVITNGIQSDISDLCEYGVPQGSALGPILFLLFINDINKPLNHIIVKLFADDTNCFISGNNFNQLERLVEVELNKLQKWINANKLTINFDPKKSNYCIFKPKNKTLPPNFDRGLNIGTNVLRYKENTKYLGVILDRNLTFETHTKELNQKLVKYAGIFSKIRHFLPVSCRKIVYNAFIASRLNYGSEIYVRTNKRHIQPLAVTQNKLLRILQFKAKKTPLKSLYTAFDVIKLKDLHYLNICCIVHKFIYSPCLLPEAINDIFRKNKQVHQYDTRQKNDLHPVKINTRLYGEKTISFQGRDYWNKLPNSLKEVTSVAVFKRKLKQHILDNY